jgi:hypothetical protein
MFDANGGLGGTDDGIAEDSRVRGYDPLIPPALIQQEIPTVFIPLLTSTFFVYANIVLVRRIIEDGPCYPSRNPEYSHRER